MKLIEEIVDPQTQQVTKTFQKDVGGTVQFVYDEKGKLVSETDSDQADADAKLAAQAKKETTE